MEVFISSKKIDLFLITDQNNISSTYTYNTINEIIVNYIILVLSVVKIWIYEPFSYYTYTRRVYLPLSPRVPLYH